MKPPLPEGGEERRGDQGQDRLGHTDKFTKPMVQPGGPAEDVSEAGGEKVGQVKDCTEEKSQENEPRNRFEVDTGGTQGICNGVDSQTDHALDAMGTCKKSRLQCKDCGKVFDRRETLNLHRHFHAHNDPAPLTCKECDLTFMDRSSFVKHRKAHKEKGQHLTGPNKEAHASKRRRFTCACCQKRFATVEKLRGHSCNNLPDKPYHCPLCRREFQFRVAITKHMQTHSHENIFQCQECGQHFSDGIAFRTHQRCHAALKPYECPECGMVFKHYSIMEDHRRKHTESLPSHQCSICGKTFKYSSLLHQHQYLHTGQKQFCCPECGKKFAFAQNMKAHYRQHRLSTAATTPVSPDPLSKRDPVPPHEPAHGPGKENSGQSVIATRVYSCPLCPLTFDIPATLRAHMLIHEAEYEKLENTKETRPMNWEKSYKCTLCPSIFHNKLSYYGHLLKGHKSESHYLEQVSAHSKCPYCNKMFRHRSVLESHMRVHTKDKPYPCKECGKSFRCGSYLRQHSVIHTGEKPHKCPECESTFAFLQNMKTHLKLHQEKPFRCSSCRNGYTDEAQLNQHMLSHNGDKQHKCNLCSKSFSFSRLLRDHMNTHKGVRPYHCTECSKSFSWLTTLRVHQKIHKRTFVSSPTRGSDVVGLEQPEDTESCQNAFQTQAPVSSAPVETKVQQAVERSLPESCPLPFRWKVDGGEVLRVSLAPNSHRALAQLNATPLKSLSDPGSHPSLEMSNMKGGSILISGSLQTAMSKTLSIVGEVTKPGPAPAEMQRGMSTTAVTSSHHFPVAYVEGAALWSIKPNPVTSTSQVPPSKPASSTSPKKDDFKPHTAILTTVDRSEERQNGDELQKQVSPSLEIISSSAQSDQSKEVLSTTTASVDVCSTLYDMQTSTGIPKTSGLSDKLDDVKAPASRLNEPHHSTHGIGPADSGSQTTRVRPPVLLPGPIKAGNTQELQHLPMAGVRPHMPQRLLLPQLNPQTGPRSLGSQLPRPPEGFLQCMICGHALSGETHLEIHYLQHAKGEI